MRITRSPIVFMFRSGIGATNHFCHRSRCMQLFPVFHVQIHNSGFGTTERLQIFCRIIFPACPEAPHQGSEGVGSPTQSQIRQTLSWICLPLDNARHCSYFVWAV